MGSGYEEKKQITKGKVWLIGIFCAILGSLAVLGIMAVAGGTLFAGKGDSSLEGINTGKKTVYHSEVGNSVSVGETVSPSVVFISNIVDSAPFMSNTEQEILYGTGSGVIYSKDGYIITNNHVVAGASKINVKLYDGTSYLAQVVGTDPRTDLAVIKIDASNLVAATFGDSDELVIGEMAVAIGNPMGEEFANSLTQGVISGLNRMVKTEEGLQFTLVQTDAAINPGNSGGALCNGKGEVIGINTIKISIPNYEGMGFAIPSNSVVEICDELIASGKVSRPALQVSIYADVDKQLAHYNNLAVDYGVLIVPVRDGVAEKAGLKTYDIIIAVDGEKVENTVGLQDKIFAKKIGDSVTITVQRNTQQLDFTFELGELE